MQLANALTLPSAGRNPHGFSTEVPRGGRCRRPAVLASTHALPCPGSAGGLRGRAPGSAAACSAGGSSRAGGASCAGPGWLREKEAERVRGSPVAKGAPRPVPPHPPGRDPLPHSPLIAPAAFGVPGSGSGLAAPASPAGRQKDVGGPRGRGARRRAEGLLTWPLAGGGQEAGQQEDDEAQQLLEPHPRGP